VDGARRWSERQAARPRYLSIILLDTRRPCTPCTHATRRGGRCVCVVRLLRNGSKTKFFQQPGRFQARTRFLSHAQGERVGSLPAHALHSRRERLTIHGTAHRTTWSHPPQRHVRGCGMLPSMSVQMCNLQVCVCASAEGRMGPPTRCYCLCLVSSHPEHEYTRGGGTNHGSSLACVVLEGSRQTWGGQSTILVHRAD